MNECTFNMLIQNAAASRVLKTPAYFPILTPAAARFILGLFIVTFSQLNGLCTIDAICSIGYSWGRSSPTARPTTSIDSTGKTTINRSYNRYCPIRDSNPGPSEYEAVVLGPKQTRGGFIYSLNV